MLILIPFGDFELYGTPRYLLDGLELGAETQ
jgi:hypothetical protein